MFPSSPVSVPAAGGRQPKVSRSLSYQKVRAWTSGASARVAGAYFVAVVAYPTSIAHRGHRQSDRRSHQSGNPPSVTLGTSGGESTQVAPRLGDVKESSAHVETNGGSIVIEGTGEVITGAVVGSLAAVFDEERIDRSRKLATRRRRLRRRRPSAVSSAGSLPPQRHRAGSRRPPCRRLRLSEHRQPLLSVPAVSLYQRPQVGDGSS